MIDIISRFNGGNGGVSIVIEQSNEHGLTKSLGEFFKPNEAVALGLEIVRKAFNSLNLDLPKAIEDTVKYHALNYARLTIPVNNVSK